MVAIHRVVVVVVVQAQVGLEMRKRRLGRRNTRNTRYMEKNTDTKRETNMDTIMLEQQDTFHMEHIQPEVTHRELIPLGPQAHTHPLLHTCHQDSAPLDSTLHQQEHTPHQVLTHRHLIQLVHLMRLDIQRIQVIQTLCRIRRLADIHISKDVHLWPLFVIFSRSAFPISRPTARCFFSTYCLIFCFGLYCCCFSVSA